MRKLLFILLIFCACNSNHRRAKIHAYKVANQLTATSGDFLYYYIIFGNNNTYYMYVASSPVIDFSNKTWTVTDEMPFEESEATVLQDIEEPMTDLPDEVDVEMSEVSEPADNSESSGESDSGDSGDSGGDGGGDGGGGGE